MFLDPAILASICGLELTAKSLVDGRLNGPFIRVDVETNEPLDAILREYLTLRGGRN